MKRIRRNYRHKRKGYPKDYIERAAENFALVSVTAEYKSEETERLVQRSADEAYAKAQTEYGELVLRIHLSEQFRGEAFAAVGHARNVTLRQKRAVCFGKARDPEI